MPAELDLKVIFTFTIFIGLFFFWQYLFINQPGNQNDYVNVENYNNESNGIFDVLKNLNKMSQFNVDNPEIAFMNTTIFAAFGVVAIFVAFRALVKS